MYLFMGFTSGRAYVRACLFLMYFFTHSPIILSIQSCCFPDTAMLTLIDLWVNALWCASSFTSFLLSVTDKQGVKEFVKHLNALPIGCLLSKRLQWIMLAEFAQDIVLLSSKVEMKELIFRFTLRTSCYPWRSMRCNKADSVTSSSPSSIWGLFLLKWTLGKQQMDRVKESWLCGSVMEMQQDHRAQL